MAEFFDSARGNPDTHPVTIGLLVIHNGRRMHSLIQYPAFPATAIKNHGGQHQGPWCDEDGDEENFAFHVGNVPGSLI
jgi:hypothetical protein